MKKIEYIFSFNNSWDAKFRHKGKEYIKDKKLQKADKIYAIVFPIFLLTFIFMSDIFFEDSFLLYILSIVIFVILAITIRYFILPKDIEKHLTLIEKGE